MTTLPEQTADGMGLTSEIRGPAGIRGDITAFLRAWLPVHAAACAAAWGRPVPVPVDDEDDKRKDGYVPHEPAAIDRWPLVAVTSGRRTQITQDWTDDGQQQFRSTYPIRVYAWVRAEGWDETQDQRDDLSTALQVTLMAHPTLDSGGRLQLVPSSVLTDFSAVVSVNGERFVAGAYVGFNLFATESLTDRLALPGAQPRPQAVDRTLGVAPIDDSGTP